LLAGGFSKELIFDMMNRHILQAQLSNRAPLQPPMMIPGTLAARRNRPVQPVNTAFRSSAGGNLALSREQENLLLLEQLPFAGLTETD
jgi:hypothetical protein